MQRKTVWSLVSTVALLLVLCSAWASFAADVEISLWTAYGTSGAVFETFAEEYMAAHPGVKINIGIFPARALEEKLTISLPSGTSGDIIEETAFAIAPYVQAGLIAEPPAWVKEFVNTSVYKLMRQGVYINSDLLGSPSVAGLKYLYWNKSMFEEAGLPGPPKTLDELKDYAQKLVQYDKNGNVIRSGISLRLSGGGYGVAEKWWMLALAPYGGSPLIETAPGKYTGGFDTEATQKAVQLYLDLLYNLKVDSYAVEHGVDAFTRETTAMFEREGFVIANLAKYAPDVKYGIAPCVGQDYWGTLCVNSIFMVAQNSSHKDVAWDFIHFISNKQNTSRLYEEAGWNPVRSDVDYSDIYAKQPMYQFMQDFPEGYGAYFYPTIVPWNEIWIKTGEWLATLFTQEQLANDPEKLAAKCQQFNEQVNMILDDNGLYAPNDS